MNSAEITGLDGITVVLLSYYCVYCRITVVLLSYYAAQSAHTATHNLPAAAEGEEEGK